MSKDAKYIIYCRQFRNSHDDRIYTYDDLDSAKKDFKRVAKEYYEYLTKIGLYMHEVIYEGLSTKEEAEGCLPEVTFITDDRLMFEVEMVKAKK